MSSHYAKAIEGILLEAGVSDVSPQAVEEWMRLQYGTLDHLDPVTFEAEALLGVECERSARAEGMKRCTACDAAMYVPALAPDEDERCAFCAYGVEAQVEEAA